MVGMPKWMHKEHGDAEDKRKQQEKATGATEKERAEAPEEPPYKPAPETDILGWGHRHTS